MPIKLWLDDVRDPAEYGLAGWTWVKTVDEAKALLKTGDVLVASLDHDLGACDECMGGMSAVDWLVTHGYASMPHCSHFGTGYDLVCWMEETGTWPSIGTAVHSANPVGAERMRKVIARAEPV